MLKCSFLRPPYLIMQQTNKFDPCNELHVELLVYGYCNMFSANHVPVEIVNLCLQFYQIDDGITLLAVGQCGTELNLFFHRNLSRKNNDTMKNSPYFDPNGAARCLIIDSEPMTISLQRLSEKSKTINYNMKNVFHGTEGCGNNWAKGFYTQRIRKELSSKILCRIRKILETNGDSMYMRVPDKQEGFGLIHSMGGGTGSGLGSLLLTKIAQEYPKQILYTISVTTSAMVSDVIVESYNSLLTYHAIKDCTDFTFILDNRALWDISYKTRNQHSPKYSDLNDIALDMINDVSFMFGKRYHGNYNYNYNNVHVNSRKKASCLSLSSFGKHMVSNSRLKYLTTVHKGMSIDDLDMDDNCKKNSVTCTIATDWDTLKYSACDVTNGLNLASVVVNYDNKNNSNLTNKNNWSSAISNEFFHDQVNSKKYHFKNKESVLFVDGVENDGKFTMSGSDGISFITNNTSITQCLNRALKYFNKLYRRKAFLHWYKGEGMEEYQFVEAQEYMTSVIQAYQDEEKLFNNGSILKKNAKYDK